MCGISALKLFGGHWITKFNSVEQTQSTFSFFLKNQRTVDLVYTSGFPAIALRTLLFNFA